MYLTKERLQDFLDSTAGMASICTPNNEFMQQIRAEDHNVYEYLIKLGATNAELHKYLKSRGL